MAEDRDSFIVLDKWLKLPISNCTHSGSNGDGVSAHYLGTFHAALLIERKIDLDLAAKMRTLRHI